MSGCCHNEVIKHFPELAQYIRWHLVSSDGPLHYIANTLHWLGYSGPARPPSRYEAATPNIEYARSSAVWPDMPESYICDPDARVLDLTRKAAAMSVKKALEDRLPALLADFRTAVESLGFTY